MDIETALEVALASEEAYFELRPTIHEIFMSNPG